LKPTHPTNFGSVDAAMATIESAVGDGPYICGDKFTAADVPVGSYLDFSMQVGMFENSPTIDRYIARLKARPAVLSS